MTGSSRRNVLRAGLAAAFLCGLVGAGAAIAQHAPDAEVWTFDRIDRIGGHPTMVLGNPRVIDAPVGKAIEFDGVDDAIFVDVHPLASAETFTWEAIFRPNGGRTEQRWFHLQEADSEHRMLFEIRVVADRWFLDSYNHSATGQRALINRNSLHALGTWYHVAAVYDGRVFSNYLLNLRCDIILPGARLQPALGDPHVDVVHLAVTFGRSEADEVLTVQLVGDALEGGAEVLTDPNLRVADARTSATRARPESGMSANNCRSLITAGPIPGRICRGRLSIRINHIVIPRAVDDLARLATQKLVDRCPYRRSARESSGCPSLSSGERVHGLVEPRQSGVGASAAIACERPQNSRDREARD